MPTYVYRCKECGIGFERFQHFCELPLKVCPECGGIVDRIIQPVGVIFKGSGFYATDHRGSSSALLPKKETKTGEEAKETKAAASEDSATD